MLDSVNTKKCKDFLNIASQFKLGELVTEQSHPNTVQLSQLALENLGKGLRCLHAVDLQALTAMQSHIEGIEALAKEIHEASCSHARIFLGGCGATGRLALCLETLNREGAFPEIESNQVIAFMAGGDTAFIRSLEGFEDRPDYGERQLLHHNDIHTIQPALEQFIKTWEKDIPEQRADLVRAEADIYQSGNTILYQSKDFGISVLTDTTERSPTFSLAPFENVNHPEQAPSLCYFIQAGAQDARTAWTRLLKRPPRSLDWLETKAQTDRSVLLGYDISQKVHQHRKIKCAQATINSSTVPSAIAKCS